MPTTRWTLIARLSGSDESEARLALDDLCRIYHYPLYCYIRGSGLNHHSAEDALHDFLSKLLRNHTFGAADREKGRMRTFLLTALKRFLINWRMKEGRQNGPATSEEMRRLTASAERRFEMNPQVDQASPDRLYDRQWASELMSQVLQSVRLRYAKNGRGELFDVLLPVLTSGGSLLGHESNELAAKLGIRVGTLRTALSRLLQEYQAELRREVIHTVADPSDAKAEFFELLAAMRSN